MIPVIAMSLFFIILLYLYYKVSVEGRISTFHKWLLAICSIGVLAIADKVKLIIWIIAVSVLWLIKILTSKKEKEWKGNTL